MLEGDRRRRAIQPQLGLGQAIGERVGHDVGYRQCGIVTPFYSQAIREENIAWLDNIEGSQHRIGVIDSDEVAALLPKMTLGCDGALYSPTDGRAEPQKAAPSMARAARAKGASILKSCAVRRIERAAGRVCGVVTERGTIDAATVVVAGGAWSRLLLRDVGIVLPQLKVLNSVLRTEPLEGGPQVTVRGPDFSARRREDGGYTVSTLATNKYDLTPDSFRFFMQFIPALRKNHSALSLRLGKRFLQEWRDLKRVRPDHRPMSAPVSLIPSRM